MMKKIKVLDCTLRDGGYCNQWKFGKKNIKKIIRGLVDAKIDVIECGFLVEKNDNPDESRYSSPKDLNDFLPPKQENSCYVVMINYGEYDIENLVNKEESKIEGIRLAFHKKDMKDALQYGKKIKEKGYTLFLQPMVSLSYSDEEFLSLIRECNAINPCAFYIVDSFGAMKQRDLIRLFHVVEHNLCEEIAIGFHSHNNMQLAYSNAQLLTDMHSKHDIIIDCCVYGMGRGAGNLNTELFVEFLNDRNDSDYKLKPLLVIIDEILEKIYQQNFWGFSIPNYLSALYNVHPNYAKYLNDKHTLTVEEMNDIFRIMENDKRSYFDKEYIEKLYLAYLSAGDISDKGQEEILGKICEKTILLIAPGKSSIEEKEAVINCANQKDIVVVSVNHDYPYFDSNFIFLSNLRRFKELDSEKYHKCIVTSNIPAKSFCCKTEYQNLLNDCEMVQDNAGLMAINFLKKCGARKIILAGMDGYSQNRNDNFGDYRMVFSISNSVYDEMNRGISKVLCLYNKEIDITFLTKEKYIRIGRPTIEV